MLYAAARLIPEKDRICGDVYVSGTVNEEQFEGVAFGEVLRRTRPDLVIIGEASEMKLKIGQRGRTEIKAEAFGKGAHSSNPQLGKNAVYTMMDYLALLRKSSVRKDDFLGEGISELTDIASAPYPGASVLPYCCTATIDRRLLCGETRESVLADYYDVLNILKKSDPGAEMKISVAYGREKTYTGRTIEGDRFFPAWRLPEDAAPVQTVAQSIRTSGFPVEIGKYSFCTNGSMSAGELEIPTLGFGPGEEGLAHTDDEYVRTDELTDACRVYAQIIRDWMGKDR
jgi:putative selenium metabolism hydrolase